ncbi:hypothetical protein DERF_013579 [Dermatophagoides farinae]|uniref:SET domain-containing protein n=1 Tax=Dermatophagoides farinae TaxID=6954 RepID=A0A922HRV7_DERFA|nr:hypothetical protein DERF_013579 [Dermatophagoides farinae]
MISNSTKYLYRNQDIINDEEIINSPDKQSRIGQILSQLDINGILKITYNRIMDQIKSEPKNEEKARCLLRKAQFLDNESNNYLAIAISTLNQTIIESGYGGSTFVQAYHQRSKCNIKKGNFEAALLDINIAIKYGGENRERSFTRSLAIFYKNLKHFIPSNSKFPDWNEIRTNIANNNHSNNNHDDDENRQSSSWKCLWDYLTNDELVVHEEKCEETNLKNLQELFEFQYNFKLDSHCAIVDDKKKGRHFICENLIPKGTQVLVERAYSLALDSQYRHHFCLHCYKECVIILCRVDIVEWPYFVMKNVSIVLVFNDDKTYMAIHMYRMITRIGLKNAITTKRHIDKMKNDHKLPERIKKYWEKNVDEFINHFVIEQYVNDEKLRNTPDFRMKSSQKNRTYQMMLSLLDHNEKYESYYDTNYIGLAIDTAFILLINNNLIKKQSDKRQFSLPHWAHLPKISLKQIINENDSKQSLNELNIFNNSYDDFAQLIEILLYNIRKLTTNIFAWNHMGPFCKGGCVATCQCLVGSLINHSCTPNVEWEFQNGCIIYTALRDIMHGEEINNSYGPHSEIPFIQRQTTMAHNYYFNCRCQICRIDVDHYPNVLKCQNCSGPVVVILESIIPAECMDCWKICENAIEKLEYVKGCFQKFFALQMLIQDDSCDDDNGEKDIWFVKMQKCLNDQLYYLYRKNQNLMKNFKIACSLHVRYGKFDIACDLAMQMYEIDEDFFPLLSSTNNNKKSKDYLVEALENRRLFYDIGKMYLQQQQQQQQVNKKSIIMKCDDNEEEDNINNRRLYFAKKMIDTYHGDNIFLSEKLFNSLMENDDDDDDDADGYKKFLNIDFFIEN